MIDSYDLRWRTSSSFVYFKNLPSELLSGAIYVENEYHEKMNRYLRRWGWWLKRFVFDKYEYGPITLTYLPNITKRTMRKKIRYQLPFFPKGYTRKLTSIKTSFLLDYLENPDDARFLKPGLLFYREEKDNGLALYEYYPFVGIDNKALSYKNQIVEILRKNKENAENYRHIYERRIGQEGLRCTSDFCHDENYADNKFESFDVKTKAKLLLFKNQVMELQKCGVPMEILERILHQNNQLSKLVVTKKYEIRLPDYNDMVIKMEPLVKAIFLLFLKHPEGIIFKHLPDYRQELIDIYNKLRPLGLNERSLQSIEDVTNPCLNSINEKCARIRGAFLEQFDEHLAKNYFITGKRGEAKKITLPRNLVVWE